MCTQVHVPGREGGRNWGAGAGGGEGSKGGEEGGQEEGGEDKLRELNPGQAQLGYTEQALYTMLHPKTYMYEF